MLRCPIAHSIVRIPEFYRVVVATCSKNNRVGIHRRDRERNKSSTLFLATPCLLPCALRGPGAEFMLQNYDRMASTRGVGEELLSVPDVGSEEFRKPFTRSSCSYENLSEKFVVKERQYGRQYAHIYHVRLMEMAPLVQAAVRKKWGR